MNDNIIFEDLPDVPQSTKSKGSNKKPIIVNEELFLADPVDIIRFQSDLPCLEFPVFGLKAGLKKTLEYKFDGTQIKISPSLEFGLPSIHDKDIWIYCVSKLMQAVKDGKPISQVIEFSMADYLKVTNRPRGGQDYTDAKNSLSRLAGTTIYTNIETNEMRQDEGFAFIKRFKLVENKDKRIIKVKVWLPDWLFNSILSRSLLTINSNYFKIRQPLKRRMYEIARKYCGYKNYWMIGVDTLHGKSGATTTLVRFRQMVKKICEDDDLPDYFVTYDKSRDLINFIERNGFDGTWKEYGQHLAKCKMHGLAIENCLYKNWEINLNKLYIQSGSTASLDEFKEMIVNLHASNDFPDFFVIYNDENDLVTFAEKKGFDGTWEEYCNYLSTQQPEPNQPTPTPSVPKDETKKDKKPREKITKSQAEAMARAGEEWPELLKRIGKKYHVVFQKGEDPQHVESC